MNDPVLRFTVMAYAIILTMLVLGMIVATIPLWLPLDPLLKHFRCQGFIRPNDDGTLSLVLDSSAFQRVS